MNEIKSSSVANLGYQFIDSRYLPKDCDEYYLRDQQNPSAAAFRKLTDDEWDSFLKNGNSADNRDMIRVDGSFDPALIRNSKFFGLVRIGKMEPLYREFHDVRFPVGIYNSTIISCDIGDNVCIESVSYLSHYILRNDVMLANIFELATTDHAKFGLGILKDGEDASLRMQVEVCNENGGRPILPFNGMLPGDAYMWSRYRDDEKLMSRFTELTQKEGDNRRGYYGVIGERTVIKNCGIIKDVNIGSDAYLKGANKIKNVTINSEPLRKSQIGEGCELVNGVIGFGCRIFYGVKAVRFVLASHSQLKYGARLINSYLGNNSTISCCEVLNSLIFPAHEQHHNNSFLCAALVAGQSNIAAGATIGSNHNSRSADGEIIAARGFWPGLCVSLKHNSKFASFTLIAKGDFPAELNISLPFCLVSNDVSHDRLILMPGYWFMYNMYALERNASKYKDRDRRTGKIQRIEYDYLAPDTVNELFDAIRFLEALPVNENDEAEATGFENAGRKTVIVKVKKAIVLFRELISYYAGCRLMKAASQSSGSDFESFKNAIPVALSRKEWKNVGGQLFPADEYRRLKSDIRNGKLDSWKEIHARYAEAGERYEHDELEHAFASFCELENITVRQFDRERFNALSDRTTAMREKLAANIYSSREKDHTGPFRKMIYETNEEMNKVLGRIEDNEFLQQHRRDTDLFKETAAALKRKFAAAVSA